MIGKYLRLVKFSHTIFALPFALIGFFYGISSDGASWNLFLLLKVLLCMVFARSAAMAFNRYIDRDIDAANLRTQIREIPSGEIKPDQALSFVILNVIMFITVTYYINPLCFYLSPVALLVILGYSYTKRFTPLCHLVLGIGLGLAPVGAYMAVTGTTSLPIVILGFAVMLWVSGFDVIYALQDIDFDKKQNLNSIPVLFGKEKALMLSRLFHVVTAGLIICCVSLWYGQIEGVYFLSFLAAGIFICLLIYQHKLVSPTDLSKVNLAFFTTNGIASVCFALFVILDLYI